MRRLTAKEYAAQFGLSPRTVRFKLQRQELPGGKEFDPVTGIPTWYVFLAEDEEEIANQVAIIADHPELSANHPVTNRMVGSEGLATIGAANPWEYLERMQKEHQAVVDRMHRENIELAGRCGFLQARVQDLEAEMRLLKAPAETPAAEVTNHSVPEQNGQDWGSHAVSAKPKEQPETGRGPEASAPPVINDQEASSCGAFKRLWRWLTQPV